MKKLVFLLLCAAVCFHFALAEEAAVLRVSEEFIAYHGRVTLYWQDDASAAPYALTYQCVSDAPDAQSVYIETDIQTTACTLDYMAPGCDYAVTVTNALGDAGTAIISLPQPLPFEDGKLSADDLRFALLACSRPAGSESSREIRHSVRLVSSEMIAAAGETEYGVRITLAYPQLAREREYDTIFVFQAPGGYICTYNLGTVNYPTFHTPEIHYQWPFIGSEFFDRLLETTGVIPAGVYTVTCYLDGMLAASAEFEVR